MAKDIKFWFANEKKVLKKLGFTPCPLSGAGELFKEDGYTDHALCQLKSTAKESYKLNLLDIQKLENNARIANKMPVFIIEFLGESTWICLKPEDIEKYAKSMAGEEVIIKYTEFEEREEKTDIKIIPCNRLEIEEVVKDETEDMFEKRKERKNKKWKK